MEAVKVENLTFAYPEADENALKEISFTIQSGEFITLCGSSGCGKTTLLRHLKPALAPHGVKSGEIYFQNRNITELSHEEQSKKIGYVMQSPDNQIVTDKVWHELAFGLESLGMDNNSIRKRVAETASFFGIQNWFDKNVSELSGGQKQLLNLASIMAMQPDILILDEPTSQLDPIASTDFLACISKINRELGTTVIITEHRLDEVLPLSSRVLVLENGEIVSFDTPQKTGENLKKSGSKVFLSLPAPMQIWYGAGGKNPPCPATVAQGRAWLESYAKQNELFPLYPEEIPNASDETAVELKNVWFSYEKNAPDVLKDFSLKINKGELVAVLGGNGTGKSTMLSILSGVAKPYRGEVKICESKVAALPQNPQSLFVKKTVALDLQEIFETENISKEEINRRIGEVVSLCKLEKLLNRHPYDLSGGEQQRAALAKVLLLQPKILLLDEPTKGLDSDFKAIFAQILSSLTQSGVTIIMVSHDIEFCAEYPHRCMLLFGGEIVSQATPREFFASNSFYVTSANRIARNVIPNAVTSKDVIYCCTGKKTEAPKLNKTALYSYNSEDFKSITKKEIEKLPLWKKLLGVFSALLLLFAIAVNLDYISFLSTKSLPQFFKYLILFVPIALLMLCFGSKSKREFSAPQKTSKIPKRTAAAAVVILLAIPLTILVGVTYLEDKKYLFISLLVMLECMLPFFLVFEGRKPQARELVIIAVLCAIAVAGRMITFMLPQFKPVVAIVIISGVAFGGESGFLVGAMSMLVSNIMFQQGPWTPWQMFSAGLIGLLAGLLFKKGFISRNRISLCIFGFISTVFIYGIIMNFSTAVTSRAALNAQTLMAFFATGFPMDIIHAIATAVILYFAAEPMLEKLDRVKSKYGLV